MIKLNQADPVRPVDRVSGGELSALFAAIGERRWTDLPPLLAEDFVCDLVHTGERFDKAGFVRLNAEYPGEWQVVVHDRLAAGARQAVRATVTDGRETYHVASFAMVCNGLITALAEVWADSDSAPPADRRPPPDSSGR